MPKTDRRQNRLPRQAVGEYQRVGAITEIARLYLICHSRLQPSMGEAHKFAERVLALDCIAARQIPVVTSQLRR